MMESRPFFSIVVPAHERPDELHNCLLAICGLDYPASRFEVIVVDDGSATALEPVVARFRDRLDGRLQLLRTAHAGPAAARNLGARAAQGEHLAFLDADCLPATDWLTAFADAARRFPPNTLLGGHTSDGCPDNPYSAASHEILDVVHAFYNCTPEASQFFPGANLAVRTRSFLAAGGFCEGFAISEDREFCYRWLERGHGLAFVPGATIRHVHPVTLWTFCRRHFNYGRGAYGFHHLRARHERHPLRLGPRSFYRHLLLHPLARGLSKRALNLGTLVVLSQLASAAGFWFEVGRGGAPAGGGGSVPQRSP
jgi:GT2 family glycosyltransferase